ncbi:hypothetical protein FQN57_002605 [Myotisia sp. PD_48]|nr:hypothetical protein FQN57_002605 [Myotisia sp. PD_48]
MSSGKPPKVGALRKQQLRLEFTKLQVAPPNGVYVSFASNNPTLWSGVLFVQKGPYASAILRFKIQFPALYPDFPPLVTFSSDLFHPLLVPFTTYTFTTGSSDTDTVSATDVERLPPGGFSLQHGFPHWFGRAKQNVSNSASSSRNASGTHAGEDIEQDENKNNNPGSKNDAGSTSIPLSLSETIDPTKIRESADDGGADIDTSISQLLTYIRSTFDDECVLDSIPLEAAGNPNAWHAWHAHRRKFLERASLSNDPSIKKPNLQSRPPGEWNWEGVWLKRAQKGIQSSYLESVLFGTSGRTGGSGDLIRFQKLDNTTLDKIKQDILASRDEKA